MAVLLLLSIMDCVAMTVNLNQRHLLRIWVLQETTQVAYHGPVPLSDLSASIPELQTFRGVLQNPCLALVGEVCGLPGYSAAAKMITNIETHFVRLFVTLKFDLQLFGANEYINSEYNTGPEGERHALSPLAQSCVRFASLPGRSAYYEVEAVRFLRACVGAPVQRKDATRKLHCFPRKLAILHESAIQ